MIRRINIVLFLVMVSTLTANADVKHFHTFSVAVSSFTSALEMRDERALSELFTAEYKTLLAVKKLDSDDIDYFLTMYKKSHKMASYDGKEVYIEVGAGGWTFPIPLVKDDRGWSFDFNIGKENMITRQIGRSELAVIEALQDAPTLEYLNNSALSDVYVFSNDDEGEIIATPKDYGESAINTFILKKDGALLEADLGRWNVVENDRFKAVDERYLRLKEQ